LEKVLERLGLERVGKSNGQKALSKSEVDCHEMNAIRPDAVVCSGL
jgi:hypothetical protein